MEFGEDLRHLGDHDLARLGVDVIAKQFARDGLARDALHDKEGRSEYGRILAQPEHLGHPHSFAVGGLHHEEFLAAAAFDPAAEGIHPDHQASSRSPLRAGHRGVERPDLARSSAGHPFEVFDLDPRELPLLGDKRLHAVDHVFGFEMSFHWADVSESPWFVG